MINKEQLKSKMQFFRLLNNIGHKSIIIDNETVANFRQNFRFNKLSNKYHFKNFWFCLFRQIIV